MEMISIELLNHQTNQVVVIMEEYWDLSPRFNHFLLFVSNKGPDLKYTIFFELCPLH